MYKAPLSGGFSCSDFIFLDVVWLLVNEESVGIIGIQNPETRDLINFDGRAGRKGLFDFELIW